MWMQVSSLRLLYKQFYGNMAILSLLSITKLYQADQFVAGFFTNLPYLLQNTKCRLALQFYELEEFPVSLYGPCGQRLSWNFTTPSHRDWVGEGRLGDGAKGGRGSTVLPVLKKANVMTYPPWWFGSCLSCKLQINIKS